MTGTLSSTPTAFPDRPDGSGAGSTIAIYNICPDAPIQTVTHCIASAEALLYAMLPDAGKIEFSHARSSLGVDLDAVKSSLPGIAALDDLFQNIENLICLCIDSWIASAVFLRDNDRSAAAGPSASIVSRLILPEASFYLENGLSNERKADAKPSDAMRCDAMIQAPISISTPHGSTTR